MKIWSVFSVVIVFHLVILGLLLVQPGCQSSPGTARPEPASTQVAPEPELLPASQSGALDPAFNAGITDSRTAASTSRTYAPPTRPEGAMRSQPDTGVLQPVLQPVRDSVALPGALIEYTVVSGDTLSGIARKQGVSLAALMEANGLNRSSVIRVGQVLQVPAASPAESSASPATSAVSTSGRSVVVAKGDTLSGLASRHGTSVRALKEVNNLSSDTIRVGQTLLLPDAAGSSTFSAPAPVASSPTVARASGSTYVVQPGDTPGGIARRFGVSSSQLMSANNISDPRKLAVGQTLVIPGSTEGSTAARSTSSVSSPVNQAVPAPRQSTPAGSSTAPAPQPSEADPMSVLEALDDEDLPFVEVQAVESSPSQSSN